MLDEGATTLWEVFDPGWSRCHAWSGSPTWQLSRNVLGMQPDPWETGHRYRVSFQPTTLEYAEGVIPLNNQEGSVQIKWSRTSEHVWTYSVQTEISIEVRISRTTGLEARLLNGSKLDSSNYRRITGEFQIEFFQN